MNPAINRQSLRNEIRARRNALNSAFQKKSSISLLTQLQKHNKVKTAKNIALYLANDSELDLTPLIEWCWQQNKNIYLPVIHPFNKGQLLFLLYNETTEMNTNRYGILEPKLNVLNVLPIDQIDIIFTPLVAFDHSGARLGMGGGYYDRTLASWYKNKKFIAKPYPIGLAHDCQKVDEIPSEHWDIPIPEIITPTKHYQFF